MHAQSRQQLQTLTKIQYQSQLSFKPAPDNPRDTEHSLNPYIIVFVICGILFMMISKIYTISQKQQQMRGLISTYQQSANTLSRQLFTLNVTTEIPFTEEEQLKYQILLKHIKNLQTLIDGNGSVTESGEVTEELMELVESIQLEVEEKMAVIGMLLAHSKQEIRKQKLLMFQKIGKKQDFQEEKVRNPWAMNRLNLRTPYIDTLQRRHMEEQIQKQAERLQQKYKFSLYPNELPICVIVPTRNNAKNFRYEYNIQSIVNQNYKNYKIVVIDDASQDGTGDLIQIFLQRSKIPKSRYFVIKNKERMTAVPNINKAIKNYCDKQDIAILISGDDQILGKLVFSIINVVYQTKKPGLAYTNHFYGHLHEKDFDKGYSRPYTISEIKNKVYRHIGQKFGHMRTFPVSLFLEIKEEHMKYRDGRWVQATYDQTFILPILQMSCDSIEYIDEYVYLYNYGTGENDGEIHHDTQSEAALYVRELPRYSCLPKYQKYVI